MTTPSTVLDFSNHQAYDQISANSWLISGYSINPGREIADLKARLAESERQRAMWETLATTDSLTGLYNRLKLDNLDQGFHENPEEHRHKNPDVSLLFIDLDGFGQFNKIYGDHVGDMVLSKLGAAINDIIRDDDLAIRKGGDEFAIFLRGSDYKTAYETVVKRLNKFLTEDFHVEIDGKPIQITGSIGAFPYNQSLSPLQNLQEADASMREVKARRKPTAIDYSDDSAKAFNQMDLPGFEPG